MESLITTEKKDELLTTADELKELIKFPDTDDLSYIRMTVRQKIMDLFLSLGDAQAVAALRQLKRL